MERLQLRSVITAESINNDYHILKKVDESFKRHQDKQQLVKRFRQVMQDETLKGFKRTSFADKRQNSQKYLKLLKEYERDNRLGPAFWQAYEMN